LSRDPINEVGGVNLYRYGNNNATNELDYLGLNSYATQKDCQECCRIYADECIAIADAQYSGRQRDTDYYVRDEPLKTADLLLAAAMGNCGMIQNTALRVTCEYTARRIYDANYARIIVAHTAASAVNMLQKNFDVKNCMNRWRGCLMGCRKDAKCRYPCSF
jgi:hypothetical protein